MRTTFLFNYFMSTTFTFRLLHEHHFPFLIILWALLSLFNYFTSTTLPFQFFHKHHFPFSFILWAPLSLFKYFTSTTFPFQLYHEHHFSFSIILWAPLFLSITFIYSGIGKNSQDERLWRQPPVGQARERRQCDDQCCHLLQRVPRNWITCARVSISPI